MPSRRSQRLLTAAVLLAGAIANPAVAGGLTDAEIQTLLQERIDQHKMGVGIVVGIVDEHGPRVISQGKTKAGGAQDVNGDTLFEIGSITKVFTTLLLQDMVDRGELQLGDPIGKFLPSYVETPSYNGRQITLVDLATHTSGLPRVPYGLWYMLFHYDDPYAAFTDQKLYKFLSHHKLRGEIGTNFEYSNLGMMLLGQVLSLKAKTNYESLVLQRICEPLKMNSTCIRLSPELKSRFAQGHDDSENPVRSWSQPLPAAGGLRSSVNDMLKFLSAEMGLTHSSLSEAMLKTQIPHYTPKDPTMEATGLGWAIDRKSGIIWHDGGTSGYMSWIDFNTKTRRGVIVLANSADDVDDLGAMLSGHLNAAAYSRRGVAREVLGDYSGAVSDYDEVIKLKPADSDWERLYRQTLLCRLGQPAGDFSKELAGCKLGWTHTLARFLAGQLDETALLAAAKKSDGVAAPEQKGLARYYIGMARLSKGDPAGAREMFEKCLHDSLKGDDEYEFAVAELARLNAAKRTLL